MGLNPLRLFQRLTPDKPLGGRYKIISRLGEGGFGQTFLAEDLHLPGHPRCVVKQLRPQFTDASSLQTASRLFDTEAKVLYQLGNHDQIPRLLAHFEDSQEFYLAQELVEGEPLTQEFIPGKPWTEFKVTALLRDVLQTLAFVHEQRVIHRDLKPPNLIRRKRDGKIVLIDFGAVKQASTQLVRPEMTGSAQTIAIGTQGYMPNEQLAGNPRYSSDIYALGMIGIQALTGIHPRQLPEDPKTGELCWRDRVPHVNLALAEILEKMVRYDFRARYTTAEEALVAVQSLPFVPTEPLPSSQTTQVAPPALQPFPHPALDEGLDDSDDLDDEANEATQRSPQTGFPYRTATGPTLPAIAPQPNLPHTIRTPIPATSAKLPLIAVSGLAALGIFFWAGKSFLSPQPNPETAAQESTQEVVTDTSPTPGATETVSSAAEAPDSQQTEQLQQANQLRETGKFEEAIAQYDQLLAANADNVEANWGKCYSLNRLDRSEEAIAACDAALAFEPNHPDALWSKGYAFDLQQRHEEALELYEQAIQQRPDFAEAWSNKGTALLMLSRPQDAVAAYDRALALDPNLAEAWNNRGAALWGLQRFDEARASVNKALELRPNYQDARKLLQEMRKRS